MEEQEKPKQEPEKDNGGIWVLLGEKQYKIPPLNFRALRELEGTLESIQKVGAIPSRDQVDAMLQVAHRAFKRNYASVALEDFAEMVDIGNVAVLISAIMNVPGARRTQPGE